LANVFPVNHPDVSSRAKRSTPPVAPLPAGDAPALLMSFVEDSSHISSVPDLIQLYQRSLLQLGYEHFACVRLMELPCADSAPLELGTVALNFPEQWVRHYVKAGYFSVDPVVQRARSAATPYDWYELSDLNREERQMMGEASEAGLRYGRCMPVHEPNGRVFLASVASEHRGSRSSPELALLHMLAVQLHTRLYALQRCSSETPRAQLTDRERECLLWSARGKSSWDISRLLSISEHTVNFHVKNAMNKLGTSTRVSAVVKCVNMGLIAP
jgi:LuxR family quorum-sensing system transcriptional regulator CciR